MSFEGKRALITGGSRGIGRAIAVALGKRGAEVAVHYKERKDAAEETAAEIERAGGKAITLSADLEDPRANDELFDELTARWGGLDIFVSSAGASAFKKVGQYGPHHLGRTFALNVQSFVLGAQRAAELMAGGGRILALSSYGSQRTFATYANMGAAKAAIESWVRSMAAEYGPRGITVNALSGGLIDTDSLHYFYGMPQIPPMESVVSRIPRRRVGTAAEMAAAALFLLSEEADYITGTTLVVDGGLSIVSPPFVGEEPDRTS
ncbi:SDR family oxidoreductase [Rubrobacter calidifluminis]|uniref:SDR family oxidoreductase n=1 Tax=Rubrobacter calidifluminis TaxID=1392640 RepID=UPI00236093F7|nr:SDR family oxidoreductase [Rubrobacter calidifluminis]